VAWAEELITVIITGQLMLYRNTPETPNRGKSLMSEESVRRPALYVVATPLGNLGDMTSRAVHILQNVDLVAAEDTRHSRTLMQHFGIDTRMVAYHDFSDQQRETALLQALDAGQAVALISDAGTPLISDPGYPLVRAARSADIAVIPVPGACAVTAALSVSGLPSDRFLFGGFPPHRRSARQTWLSEFEAEPGTLIFYESPHRIANSVTDMRDILGADREAVICRELTKTWETVKGGTLAELVLWLAGDDNNRRGEFVVLVRGVQKTDTQVQMDEAIRVLDVLLAELPVRQAAALAASITGTGRNVLYKAALDRKPSSD
jgi:16S rRNA (cytidine1402-2'-O)-methyltransferase